MKQTLRQQVESLKKELATEKKKTKALELVAEMKLEMEAEQPSYYLSCEGVDRIYISKEQKEILERVANIEKDENLNPIYVINKARFQINIDLKQMPF